MTTLRIATRRSPLALWQAEHVRDRLQSLHPGLTVELLPMSTVGDRILDAPLAKIGGKGLFVKELEQALLENRADIAVHSMKDVPVDLPEGLHIGAIMEREDPRDALVGGPAGSIAALPHGAVIGTSSLRRQCQLRGRRPDLDVRSLRGNVGTRLSRLDAGEYAAIILAAAGVRRLGLADRVTAWIAPEDMLPAIAQGALGIECRTADARVQALIDPLAHAGTALRIRAERAINRRLHGGCQVPIAGYAELEGDTLYLRALVGRPDGSSFVEAQARGPAHDPETLGTAVAETLLERGAGAILAALDSLPG